MFEKIKKVSACALAIVIGLLIGRQLRSHFYPSHAQDVVVASYRSDSEKSFVARKPVVRHDISWRKLSLSEIETEVDRQGYPDDRYMVGQWFAGRPELLIETKKSLEVATRGLSVDSGVSHFTLSDDFHDAVSDEDKRRIFHDYTRARLYNMLMLLEVAKRRDLIPKAKHASSVESGAETTSVKR